MDGETRKRLDLAAHAVIRWFIRTNYERLISDAVKKQIERTRTAAYRMLLGRLYQDKERKKTEQKERSENNMTSVSIF